MAPVSNEYSIQRVFFIFYSFNIKHSNFMNSADQNNILIADIAVVMYLIQPWNKHSLISLEFFHFLAWTFLQIKHIIVAVDVWLYDRKLWHQPQQIGQAVLLPLKHIAVVMTCSYYIYNNKLYMLLWHGSFWYLLLFQYGIWHFQLEVSLHRKLN